MSNDNNQTSADQAQQALNSIQGMKEAAHRRAAPPHLFGAAIAALAGSLVTFAVTDNRELQILSIVMITLVIVYQVSKTKVNAAQSPNKLFMFGLVALLPLYFIMVVLGQSLVQSIGKLGAGLTAGAIFASLVFALNYLENKWYINKGKKGGNS